MFRIARFYLQLISKARRNGSAEELAGWSLSHKKSYRNPSSVRISGLLKNWLRTFSKVFSSHPQFHSVDGGKADVMVWDNRDVKNIRVEQIRMNKAELPGIFVARNELTVKGSGARLNALFTLIWFLPGLIFRSVFHKMPGNIALLPVEWLEAVALMQVVKTSKVRLVYFYCPYENDANALYLLLKAAGVKVNKIPSPNLLSIGNADLLSDELTLTSPCQADELAVHAETLRVTSVKRWLPEQFYQYADKYISRTKPALKSVGYYSHGSWLRDPQIPDNVGDVKAELALLPAFSEFLHRHPDFSCVIFLHPKEKKSDMTRVSDYYSHLLGKDRFTFAPSGKSGAELFDSVDIGIGALSTILFERLFLGNKTIFYPKDISLFPIPGADISKICARNEIELEQLILQSASVTAGEFRKLNRLDKYTVHEWIGGSAYGRQD